ncbi:hypothetical protein [Niabella hibiscisoli]|uniref:hypothetical protein n=1 Tax=Niabella hibiscisoli TaxID=1825928 RepID=UPI001F0FC439|nr:hypothetical protein [Niabella hibiscisoli]MCH5714708.1 hypothetical protein [Niabella hibiscisoli]
MKKTVAKRPEPQKEEVKRNLLAKPEPEKKTQSKSSDKKDRRITYLKIKQLKNDIL